MTDGASSHRHLKGVVSFLTWDLGRVSPGEDVQKAGSEVMRKVRDYAQTYEIDVISLQNVGGAFERELEGYRLIERPAADEATWGEIQSTEGEITSCLVTFVKEELIPESSASESSTYVHTVELKIEDDFRLEVKSINNQCHWGQKNVSPIGAGVSLGVLRGDEESNFTDFSDDLKPAAKTFWPDYEACMSGWVYAPEVAAPVEEVHVLEDSLGLCEDPALLAYFLVVDDRSEAFKKC